MNPYFTLVLITLILLLVSAPLIIEKFEHVADPTFHILIATAGRQELKNMLDSLKPELTERDAITIVFDGNDSKGKSTLNDEWLKDHKASIKIIEQDPRLGFWGHGIRNEYQTKLLPKTTFVMHADDDDTYIPGSFDKLRKTCNDPDILYLTQLTADDGKVIFPHKDSGITLGGIGTPNGVIPFDKAGNAIWDHKHGGDYYYYNMLKDHVKDIVYTNLLIYKVR
jgi:hypothetical protein